MNFVAWKMLTLRCNLQYAMNHFAIRVMIAYFKVLRLKRGETFLLQSCIQWR
jgi:hypothetical protein